MSKFPLKKTTSDAGISICGVRLYLLPIETRVPLKFGSETLTSVTCARACVAVESATGDRYEGWGETPISVQWAWPSTAGYTERYNRLEEFCRILAKEWADFSVKGHPLEIGHDFQKDRLGSVLAAFNKDQPDVLKVPYLAALVCCSVFDQAIYDAYGVAVNLPVYETLGSDFLNRDLGHYLTPAVGSDSSFQGVFPAEYLTPARTRLPAWHLVGGLDPIDEGDDYNPVDDGHPVLLRDWITRDGLKCLKVKLRGTDAEWDYQRLVSVGEISLALDVTSLTADFNCTVMDPQYVIDILNRLANDHTEVYDRILYVEQPFPYELSEHMIDVRRLAAMKPLLMDESAHDWEHVQLGHSLGWNGVALKTCKTQTGAILSMCWARAHGMHLMVQDLTNPMLAQLPHVQLAANIPTMMGVETNAMQFYPAASDIEAKVHPGIYQRRNGQVDLSTISGPGFGYRVAEIGRELPDPVVSYGD